MDLKLLNFALALLRRAEQELAPDLVAGALALLRSIDVPRLQPAERLLRLAFDHDRDEALACLAIAAAILTDVIEEAAAPPGQPAPGNSSAAMRS